MGLSDCLEGKYKLTGGHHTCSGALGAHLALQRSTELPPQRSMRCSSSSATTLNPADFVAFIERLQLVCLLLPAPEVPW